MPGEDVPGDAPARDALRLKAGVGEARALVFASSARPASRSAAARAGAGWPGPIASLLIKLTASTRAGSSRVRRAEAALGGITRGQDHAGHGRRPRGGPRLRRQGALEMEDRAARFRAETSVGRGAAVRGVRERGVGARPSRASTPSARRHQGPHRHGVRGQMTRQTDLFLQYERATDECRGGYNLRRHPRRARATRRPNTRAYGYHGEQPPAVPRRDRGDRAGPTTATSSSGALPRRQHTRCASVVRRHLARQEATTAQRAAPRRDADRPASPLTSGARSRQCGADNTSSDHVICAV